MRYLLLFVLGLLALGPPTRAQQLAAPVVEGTVRTSDGRPVLSGGVLFTASIDPGRRDPWTSLDSTGAFRLTGRPGPDTLRFSSRYYGEVTLPLMLVSDTTVRVDIVTELRPPYDRPLVLGEPDTTGQASLLRFREAAARAVGLSPLRTTTLPESTREIRLSNDGGFSNAGRFVRVLNENGRISGQVVTYVPVYTDRDPAETALWMDGVRYDEGPRCDSLRTFPIAADSNLGRQDVGVLMACVSRFRDEPDWSAVWAALDAHGAWTLPDDSALPRDGFVTFDGWGLQVEVRTGESYRSYYFANPDGDHPFWAPHRDAFALGALLDREVYAHLLPEGGRARYRGHAVQADGLPLFFPCDASGPWLLDFLSDTTVSDRLEREHVLYVEADGLLQPPGRYTRRRMFLPTEEIPADEPVFARRLYLMDVEGAPPNTATLPRPGDCSASPPAPGDRE